MKDNICGRRWGLILAAINIVITSLLLHVLDALVLTTNLCSCYVHIITLEKIYYILLNNINCWGILERLEFTII